LGMCGAPVVSGDLFRGDDEHPAELDVVAVGMPVTALALGSDFTCALVAGGSVRCWGYNHEGKLGYGHTESVGDDPGEMPPPDVAIGGVVTQLAAGWFHSCALLEGGRVRCWGHNLDLGLLGLGYALDNVGDEPGEMPPPDVPIGGVVTQLTAGNYHSCALLEGGRVRCWGASGDVLGFGDDEAFASTYDYVLGDAPGEMPPPDVDLGGPVVQLAAGSDHTCALLTTGDVRCWGANSVGQLGLGHTETIGDDEAPASVDPVALGGRAIQVVAGLRHSCALLEDGAVRCWGSGEYGVLGHGALSMDDCIMPYQFSCAGAAYCCIGDDEAPETFAPISLF
ncbi:MAG: hypothetical protein KC636_36345, partial [Myxococcales bacterium]|nr:hypothetical protein [Myxococcales bacterium]